VTAGGGPGPGPRTAAVPAGNGRTPASGLAPLHLPEAPAAGPSRDPGRRGDVDVWGRSERARTFARRVFDPFYRSWFRVRWEGLEHLPTTGGALLVANHAGAVPMDAPVIVHGIEQERGRPVYTLAENVLWTMPFVGTVFSRVGGVNAHPDNAYRLLHDDGALALVFPEGTKATGKPFTERYRLRRFGRGGFVQLAARAGVPVVPIAVVGSEEAMPNLANLAPVARVLRVPYVPVTAQMLVLGPLGAFAFLPAQFTVRVLEPVDLDLPPGRARYSAGRVMEEAERIRQRIQEALHDMLRRRSSVWRG
jgi:1-acyl-sn-glycerol-3-phosphate acyltransferase